MTIGERVKKIRSMRKLSTYDLSKLTGVSQSSISKLENGKRKPDSIILEKLAGGLEVSIDRLTGDSVSSIIESRLEELNLPLEQVAEKSGVPLKWLQNIDSFVPGEMEFMIEEPHGLDWDAVLGDYTSYKWISQVAEVIGVPGNLLRAALARQEIPLPDDTEFSPISAEEAFGISSGEDSPKNFIVSSDEKKHLCKYRKLDEHGQDMVDTVLDKEYKRCTKTQENSQSPVKNITEAPMPSYLLPNAAHERTDIEYTEEDRQADEDMLD